MKLKNPKAFLKLVFRYYYTDFFFMCLDNDDEFNVSFLAFICLNTWKTYKAQIYRAEDI